MPVFNLPPGWGPSNNALHIVLFYTVYTIKTARWNLSIIYPYNNLLTSKILLNYPLKYHLLLPLILSSIVKEKLRILLLCHCSLALPQLMLGSNETVGWETTLMTSQSPTLTFTLLPPCSHPLQASCLQILRDDKDVPRLGFPQYGLIFAKIVIGTSHFRIEAKLSVLYTIQ